MFRRENVNRFLYVLASLGSLCVRQRQCVCVCKLCHSRALCFLVAFTPPHHTSIPPPPSLTIFLAFACFLPLRDVHAPLTQPALRQLVLGKPTASALKEVAQTARQAAVEVRKCTIHSFCFNAHESPENHYHTRGGIGCTVSYS